MTAICWGVREEEGRGSEIWYRGKAVVYMHAYICGLPFFVFAYIYIYREREIER
jgi:hypothetical protein